MSKRLLVLYCAIVMLFLFPANVLACNESQSNTYVTQIIFGDNAYSRSSDEKVKMLLDALYLCCEQANNLGQDKLDYLKSKRVSGVPSLSNINIPEDNLLECSHNRWEYEFAASKRNQANRRKLLQNTVNKVFDFGVVDNIFGAAKGQCNSFAALLYYSHILSDYLADNPSNTESYVANSHVPSFAGQPYVEINGNRPLFTESQKTITESFRKFSDLDSLGRAGVAFANVGPDIMPPSNSRQQIGMIRPTGWNQNNYKNIIGNENTPGYIYQRCHLIAHQLVGVDSEINLITGTQYLNNIGMKPIEDEIADYIRKTNNHVLYRVTPTFKGDNLLASGVQIEAFSVEDSGEGICYNVYCYNVQPGFELNYENGKNELADQIYSAESILPFAVYLASDNNSDLIFEMKKHLEILFQDQKDSGTYKEMMNMIDSVASEARAVGNYGRNETQQYIELKKYQYKFFEILRSYVPLLLEKESFFTSAF